MLIPGFTAKASLDKGNGIMDNGDSHLFLSAGWHPFWSVACPRVFVSVYCKLKVLRLYPDDGKGAPCLPVRTFRA